MLPSQWNYALNITADVLCPSHPSMRLGCAIWLSGFRDGDRPCAAIDPLLSIILVLNDKSTILTLYHWYLSKIPPPEQLYLHSMMYLRFPRARQGACDPGAFWKGHMSQTLNADHATGYCNHCEVIYKGIHRHHHCRRWSAQPSGSSL